MKKSFLFLFVSVCAAYSTVYPQNVQSSSLNIGDTAPPLHVSEWIKGKPVEKLEKGHVYVVEFWSTWCSPCINAMPHLSKLARKYKRQVTVVGINVLEKRNYPREKGRTLVDSMGRRVKYALAFEDSNVMKSIWMDASGEYAIPTSFVVNNDSKIAWIGHPNELDTILPKLLENTWDINTAYAKRNFEHCIYEADNEAREEYSRFCGTAADFYGEPDSVLFYISKIVSKDPDLKYAFNVACNTFGALLKTDMKKAYEYAKEALRPSNPLGPARDAVLFGIRGFYNLDMITPEIYLLGAEAMNGYAADTPKNLVRTAEYYWRAGDKANARRYLKKAQKAMKAAKIYGKGYFF